MQTSGLVLDLYDDSQAEILRGVFPTREEIPELIKEAHPLSREEQNQLPDDAFALVLLNGDQKLRKYACTDAGNVALSLLYFEKNAHKLPVEAQQVGAENLCQAAAWYGLEVPEQIQKLAGLAEYAMEHPVRTATTALVAGPVIKGTHEAMSRRGRVASMAGGQALTPEEFQEGLKYAEANGTDVMSIQQSPEKKGNKTVIPKTATVGRLVSGHETADQMAAVELAQAFGLEQVPGLPQSKALKPHVDVSNKQPPRILQTKKASRYALEDRYPLDSYVQVKTAASYFEEYWKQFSPEQRHEYCQNLVKRAEELCIDLGEEIRKYGSSTYAPVTELKVAMDSRRSLLSDAQALKLLDALEEKQAMVAADTFCIMLEEFDKVAGLNYHYDDGISDPYYSTFGFDKVAEEYSYIDGNDHITEHDLVKFGKTRHKQLVTTFGDEFAEEFRKDPVGIFKSLPKDQKRMVLHMAVDNAPGADTVP